jgi:hypothetical protein
LLSTADINAELERLSYMPGWSFKAYDHPDEGQMIRIVGERVLDSYNPGETLDIGVNSFLPPLSDEWDLRRWLKYRLKRIATHEVLEWLKLDGEPIWDPHRVTG